MEFEISSPETVVTARNRNRSLMARWGVNGAGPGLISRFLRNPDTEGEISLGNTDIVHCGPGDVIRVIGPGAGGYGDPFTRPQQAVLRDVRRGAVSAENAARHYGVALIGDEIDEEATAALRSTPRRKTDDIISYGPERLAFEAVWTRERYDLLTQFLQKSPVGWRFFLKHRVFEAVENEGDDPRPLCERMAGIFDRISARYGV